MFLDATSIEKNILRQGDIINNTHLLGAINLNAINYEYNAKMEKVACRLSQPLFGPAMVLSHSCELDRANNSIKVTSIILAPIRNINDATKPDKVKDLIDSNLITDATTHSYLKYFYLEPHALLPAYDNGSIVDFSKSYSVRNQSYDQLLINKTLQLQKPIADNLALKLCLYFYRTQTA